MVMMHRINLGLKITLSNWYGKRVKIYDIPDAVELARRMDHHFRGEVAPTRIDRTFKQLPPAANTPASAPAPVYIGGCP